MPARIYNTADLSTVGAKSFTLSMRHGRINSALHQMCRRQGAHVLRLMDCIGDDEPQKPSGLHSRGDRIGIYTIFLYIKYNELKINLAPSPIGEGWGEENKINYLYPPHPRLLPEEGRRSRHLCEYPCGDRGNDINHREHEEHEVFWASFLRGLRDLRG